MSNKIKTVSFVPNKLDDMYLNHIKGDCGKDKTELFRYIIRNYFLMQYGEEARREIREQYTEAMFNEYD